MLHHAVAWRNGNVPAKAAIGFSKHHSFKRVLPSLLHRAAPSGGEYLSDTRRPIIRQRPEYFSAEGAWPCAAGF
jgi:hypothetical protein